MKYDQKVEVLKGLKTRELIDKLHEYEDVLDTALREEASFKDLNYGYLSGTGDCAEVKRISAELLVKVPETIEIEKPLTKAEKSAWLKEQLKLDPKFPGTAKDAPETATSSKPLAETGKKAWLERQRTDDQELLAAIARQQTVSFNLDNFRINIEMAKKRLEGLRAVISLKTAQLRFLSDSD